MKMLERSQVLQGSSRGPGSRIGLESSEGKGTAPGGKAGSKPAGEAAGHRGPAHIPVARKKADHKKPGNF